MATVKKKKLKKSAKILLFLGILIVVLISVPVGYRLYHGSRLGKLHYDKAAIQTILKKHKQSYVYEVGENKTINAAFQSKDYQEKNLKIYQEVPYQEQKDLIKNINLLVAKEYTTPEISAIVSRGNNEEVSAFAKRDKEEDVLDFLQFDYAKLANYDRYVAYSMQEREDDDDTVTYVNLNLDKPYYEDAQKVTEQSLTMLVNKYHQLGEDYEPKDLMKIQEKYAVDDEQFMIKEAVIAFEEMAAEAEKEGYSILANSAYRSYQDQQDTYDLYLNTYGQKYVDNYVAVPGYSEHQTGLALDVASGNSKIFADSKEYNWMLENSYKFGFVMRYPKSEEQVTGYKYESWHYRYLGKELAKKVYDSELTYDEYYARFLDR